MSLEVRVADSLDGVPADDWNALAGDRNPFLRHEFLAALERHDCLHPYGWQPHHLLVRDRGALVAALPLYLKDNSYGEFVFDHAWADAYHREGLRYYPKLVASVPYSPVTGPRCLIAPGQDSERLTRELCAAAIRETGRTGCSSLHILFPGQQEMARLAGAGLMRRTGVQFHWRDRGYAGFDAFLAALSARRRKAIRRERREAGAHGLTIEILSGHDIDDRTWRAWHRFYRATFDRKSGMPTLTLAFFRALGRTMPDNVVLVMARDGERHVAGAFNLRGADTLFGRHWGCERHYRSLHFELCYYRLIEYCLDNGLRRFEAGAQGEHKLLRGFLPQRTWSAHWLADPRFGAAIAAFLAREERAMDDYITVLGEHSPFREDRRRD